jgi:hypothetical protein
MSHAELNGDYIHVANTGPVVITDSTLPKVLHQGRYRLYEKPDGSLRIQYRRDDREEDDFLEIPGAVIRMAKAASEGKMSPLELIRMLRNNGG